MTVVASEMFSGIAGVEGRMKGDFAEPPVTTANLNASGVAEVVADGYFVAADGEGMVLSCPENFRSSLISSTLVS
jgi:hypothetical protein